MGNDVIDQLTGEALDRAVHEKVFGLKVPERHVCGCVDYVYAVTEKGLPLCPACEQRGDPLVRAVEPYSSNLCLAFDVLERWIAHVGPFCSGKAIGIELLQHDGHGGSTWSVYLSENGHMVQQVSGTTLEAAICRAAIRALGS